MPTVCMEYTTYNHGRPSLVKRHRQTPTATTRERPQNRRRSTIAERLLKIGDFLDPRNSKRYNTIFFTKGRYFSVISRKDDTEILLLQLYESSGEGNNTPPEYKYHYDEKNPETFHLSLFPPCQFALNLYDFCVHAVPVNDTIAIYHFFFCRNRQSLWLI